MSAPRILVVEDNPIVSRVLESQLTASGYEVVTVATGSAALQEITTQRPDLMILDLTLEGEPSDSMRDGFALLGWLRFTLPDAKFPIIIHTVDDSPKVKTRAQATGVYAVLRKGEGAHQLLETVQQALAQSGGQVASAA